MYCETDQFRTESFAPARSRELPIKTSVKSRVYGRLATRVSLSVRTFDYFDFIIDSSRRLEGYFPDVAGPLMSKGLSVHIATRRRSSWELTVISGTQCG